MRKIGTVGARVRAATGVLCLFAVTGCLGPQDAGTAEDATDSGGPITVWVDPPRVPAVNAFTKAHPEIQVEVNTINGNVGSIELQQKFALFNQAGEGWPDAIFFPSNDDIAWATSSKINYARDLSVDLADVISGYSPAVISQCVIDGKTRCLRNDAAPDVLWYNAVLFEQWGYEPPETWEEYEELSITIADQHPGYITGFLGDAYAPDRYLWASGCPTNDRLAEDRVHLALDDPRCNRVRDMLGRLVDAKALASTGIFSPDAAGLAARLAMSPGAVWWANFLLRDAWKVPAGQISAAKPLRWSTDDQPFTSSEGGGLWGFSRHIKGTQLANALTFARFVAADPRWQVELSVGLPGYGPLQEPWLAKQRTAGYLVDFDACAASFTLAATIVRPDREYTLYNTGTIWTQTITPTLTSGKRFDEAWNEFTSRLLSEAKTFGYEIQSAV